MLPHVQKLASAPFPPPPAKLTLQPRHEEPLELDSLGLLTLVDPYDVPPTAVSTASTEGGVDDDEEVSVVLAGSDPIGRVRLADTAAARGAFLLRSDGVEEEEGGWVGGGGEKGGGGAARHHQEGRGPSQSHSHREHSHGHGHGHGSQAHGVGAHGKDATACCGGSAGVEQNGVGHSHDHGHGHVHGHGHADGHACNGHHGGKSGAAGEAEVEMKKVHGKHGAAAVGGHGEGHGHEHRVHGHLHAHDGECGGGGCSHESGHAHGAECGGGGGGCKGHGSLKSMNLWAVLVHAIADAVSSGVVCVQGELFAHYGSEKGRR